MKTIPLTQGKEAIVSDCDYKYLMQWKWYYNKSRVGGYAVRNSYNPQKHIYMHRIIAERKGITGQIDHKNQRKLDNRRCNLRTATATQNKFNRTKYHNNTSGFKGVNWNKRDRKWQAYIGLHGKLKSLGYHDTKEEAAKAYNKAAKKYFGEYACLNPLRLLLK